MIKNISFNFRPDDRTSIEIISDISELLARRNIGILLPDYPVLYGTDLECHIRQEEEYLAVPDFIIAIGGDGTFLKTARLFLDNGSPIFGINRGKLGFLTEFSPMECRTRLMDILENGCITAERNVMEAVYNRNGENRSIYFFNDAVISKGAFSRAIEIELHADDMFLIRYSGDGLIVATSTGSTAYSLSAGGPIVVPDAKGVYIVNPVCPHSLAMRPLVLPVSTSLKATTLTNMTNLLLTIDGQEAIEFSAGDELVFQKTDRIMTFVLHPEKNYFSILREKLNWG